MLCVMMLRLNLVRFRQQIHLVSLRQQRHICLGKDVWIKLETEFHMNPVIQMVILSCAIFFSFTRITNLQH